MGKVARFPSHPDTMDAYPSVNPRPASKCRLMPFLENRHRYAALAGFVGLQYAEGEEHDHGFHVMIIPETDGPIPCFTQKQADGRIYVSTDSPDFEPRVYDRGEVVFVGFAFQFIENWETMARWEYITGAAVGAAAESIYERPVLIAQ